MDREARRPSLIKRGKQEGKADVQGLAYQPRPDNSLLVSRMVESIELAAGHLYLDRML